MPAINITSCQAFIDENRHIAGRYKERAEAMIEDVQTVGDMNRRIRLAALSEVFGRLAIEHATMARQQEIDLGFRCYCPNPSDLVDELI